MFPHLREGVAALYARTLRSNAAGGLSKRDAEAATERRLCGSPYFIIERACFVTRRSATPTHP